MLVNKELLRDIEWDEPKEPLSDKWFFAAEIFTIASFILSVWGLLL